MSGSKIRNIAIAVLLLINALFLAVIIYDAAVQSRLERETIENVSAIMKAGGIQVDPDSIRAAGALRTMRTARVIEIEEAIARTLLGDTVITDQGVIYLYENPERGIAEFYSAGDFEVRLNAGVITNENGSAAVVRSLLREMRLETTQLTAEFNQESGIEVVSVVAAYRGASIFNGLIEFVFVGESLLTVGGRYVAGIEPAEDGIEISQVSSALLGFLSAVRDEGREDIASAEIFGVESGFRHRVVGAFGEGVLDPAWLITTDNGAFLIDDATGEIWPLG
ncbi:MAG: hypothetical protein FWB97_11265 [Oscillospiraceae bacterium]|nr:hypothetical protein [Oscillospiraceae bacterium]